MSFNSNRSSRDGKPNKMNKTNNEKKFNKDRGSRRPESPSSSSRDTPNRSFDKDRKPGKDFSSTRDRFSKKDDKRPSDRKPFTNDRDQRPKPEGRFSERSERDDRRSSERKPFNTDKDQRPRSQGRPSDRSERDDRRSSERKPFNTDKDQRPRSQGRPSDRPERDDRRSSERKPFNTDKDQRPRSQGRPFDRLERSENPSRKPFGENKDRQHSSVRPRTTHSPRSDKPFLKKENDRSESPRKRSEGKSSRPSSSSAKKQDDGIRLNRYIANAGVCSRRKADELIEAGVVSVNGEVVTALGTKVMPNDDVRYNGERLKREKMVYVLLNKPKDYITTTDDPQERRTVMHLVEKATNERIYPVGRLDRNTTGLLLMTNDGSLAEKLSHPRNSITKIYHVELDKNLNQGDLNKIQFGLELEDGLIKPDEVSYVQGASKREIGIQIHSGKNRIVRRIFESLGYTVVKLDRVIYANLTKKDLPRGRWRYLEEREIVQLKHFMK